MKNETNRSRHYLLAIVSIILLVALDQLVKYIVVQYLKGQPPVILIQNVFQFEYVENRGAAFGILENMRGIFYACVLFISGIVFYIYSRIPMDKKFLPLRLCGVFLLAGAYGNMIDRLVQNYVVDFLYFKLIDFPVFNVADIYVTCAAFAMILLVLFYYKEADLDQIFHKSGSGQNQA